jgi:hypothetical protein
MSIPLHGDLTRHKYGPPTADGGEILPTSPDSKELPPLQQALQIVRECEKGNPPAESWTELCLDSDHYSELNRQLEAEVLKGFFEDKIR